jgi:PIN domain
VTTVVIDSNAIVRRDWFLTSEPWRLVSYQSRSEIVDLLVPEIVVRETVGAYGRALRELLAKVEPIDREFTAMKVRAAPPGVDADACTDEYERELRACLAQANARSPEPPQSLTVLDLADRAIARRRPFNDSGNGFRDAVIWHHVLDALRPNYQNVAFISDDRKAFYGSLAGSKGTIALLADLRAEAETVNATSSLSVFAFVSDFLIACGTPDPSLMLEVSEIVQREQVQLTINLDALLTNQEVDPWEGDDRLLIKRVLGTLRIVAQALAVASPEGLVLVELTGNGTVLASAERWHPVVTITEVPASLYCGVSATYDQREGLLDNLTLAWVEVIDHRLPRAMWYDQPLPLDEPS